MVMARLYRAKQLLSSADMKLRWKTWGERFEAALAHGYDHGYAAYLADRYEERFLEPMRKARTAGMGREPKTPAGPAGQRRQGESTGNSADD